MLALLSSCRVCPHKCAVNRLQGETGVCRAGRYAKVYSHYLHFGEEPVISFAGGSGTIFFSHCNAKCVYCQNHKFSQAGEGEDVTEERLAGIMIKLQNDGACNINLVTPTHFVPQIIIAVKFAREKGLNIPIVYNTNGYELPETLELLQDIVDIYLPDMRYDDDTVALKYSALPNYTFYNKQAVKIMYQQKGTLVVENGIAKKGVIIRHLVLPDNLSGTRGIMKFIKTEISQDVHISLMCQYYPVYKSSLFPEINRQITKEEYQTAQDAMDEYGLENGWRQTMHDETDRSVFLGENF